MLRGIMSGVTNVTRKYLIKAEILKEVQILMKQERVWNRKKYDKENKLVKQSLCLKI